jgi:hypothetical protein
VTATKCGMVFSRRLGCRLTERSRSMLGSQRSAMIRLQFVKDAGLINAGAGRWQKTRV